MTTKNCDMPAMPINNPDLSKCLELGADGSKGFTKREKIAMYAMSAWIIHHGASNDYGFSSSDAAASAVESADALLKELEK